MRHQPSLKAQAMKAIVKLLEEVVQRCALRLLEDAAQARHIARAHSQVMHLKQEW